MKCRSIRLALMFAVLIPMACSPGIIRAQSGPRTIEIHAKKFAFDPSDITLKKGQPVILVLKSSDVAHGLRFRELNVDLRARSGTPAQTQFTPEKTGDFVGHCSVFCGSGHGSMKLTLHVVD